MASAEIKSGSSYVKQTIAEAHDGTNCNCSYMCNIFTCTDNATLFHVTAIAKSNMSWDKAREYSS